ncbi:MAG: hypothetical protein R3E77_08100 [Steroidobacteraceae bacterium]
MARPADNGANRLAWQRSYPYHRRRLITGKRRGTGFATMMPIRPYIIALLAALFSQLGACRYLAYDCHKPALYQQAQSIAPLKVPAGLEAPDTSNALRIPEVVAPAAPAGSDGPCLESPPEFQTTRQAPPAA